MVRARAAASVLGLVLLACGSPPSRSGPTVARAWEIMGTVFTVGAWGRDSAALLRAVESAFDSVRLVDSLLSTFRDDSEIMAVNRGAGSGARSVSPTFRAVLHEALLVAELSGGAFDPTLRDWRGVHFDTVAGTVRLRPGLKLDFGGIAKGYALDRAGLALRGVADTAVLDLGGQLLVLTSISSPPRATGNGPRSWPVGISDPDHPLDVMALIEIPTGHFSVSTSSQAEQPGHIRDARTGTAAGRARSVTVVAPTGMAADAWSTALFVLGCDSALTLGERAGVSVLCADRAIRWTRDLEGRVALATDSVARGRGP